MARVNTFEEVSAVAAGTVTGIIDVADAPSLTNSGRFFALVYVEGTGDAQGTVQVQVRPKGSANIVSWIEALGSDIVISSGTRTSVQDFVAARGMECRAIVKTFSGSGTINVRLDLGIS